MQSGVTEREIRLAKKLASNSKKVRDKTVKALHRYLRNCSESELDEVALQKLWKGLFYCMWMSDKRPVQLQLATSIANLIHHLPTVHNQFTFFKCFLLIISREWHGIDNLRLDKFYDLVKKVVTEALGIALKGAKQAANAPAQENAGDYRGDDDMDLGQEEDEEEEEEEPSDEAGDEEESDEDGSDGEEEVEDGQDRVGEEDIGSTPMGAGVAGEEAVFGWMSAMVSGLDEDQAVGAVLHVSEHFLSMMLSNLPAEEPTPETLTPTHLAALLFPFFQLIATSSSNLVVERIRVEVFGRILKTPKVTGEEYATEDEYFADQQFVTKAMHMEYLRGTRRFAEYFETIAASLFELAADPNTSDQQRGKIYRMREDFTRALVVPMPKPEAKKVVFEPKTSTEVVHKRKKGKKRKLTNTELKKRRKRRRMAESKLMPA